MALLEPCQQAQQLSFWHSSIHLAQCALLLDQQLQWGRFGEALCPVVIHKDWLRCSVFNYFQFAGNALVRDVELGLVLQTNKLHSKTIITTRWSVVAEASGEWMLPDRRTADGVLASGMEVVQVCGSSVKKPM